MLGLLLATSSAISDFPGDKDQITVGYYTMVKLQHVHTKLFLSGLEYRYQSGSFQQIVRGISTATLGETFWTVYPPPEEGDVPQGRPVVCGATVRLQHAATGAWLHSHDIAGHFGSGYEVTGFDGSDSGDFWEVECSDVWAADTPIRLRHLNTNHFLAVNASSTLPEEDGGEIEVFASETASDEQWVVAGGLFVEDNE